ncbi:putative oligosaccharyl transferase stt3 subunit protein [Botrytis fragariae]|uniref:Putative oligosaccharyl transferase stt3 subunit protein n=1 Tax=Botrytis fragariae TaxID=1964551 RepID=A0A8H6EKY8_9HELO|nr:putative oligosaccharyl transferase stt3 subunit protein [Botrytis fragariae]KAF5876029.1 putative oligosaccharyl transferase stt3 subunit protein [Botrytis fragariae]
MLTMLRAGSRSDDGSDTTEEIVRDGYPYYFKKNNGRMVMARKISTNRGKKNFSLLGQAFGIREPKRKTSIEALRKKKKLARFPIPRPPYSTAHPPQHFPAFAPPPIPYAPNIPQQPFPNPNFFAQTAPGFPPFYPVPGFPAAPAPVPASTTAQQPMRFAFPPKASKAPDFEELRKVESDFLNRAKSKSKRDGKNDGHTEIKTTTTTVITKHICVSCQRDRSSKYHLDNPIKAGETPTPGFCRRCRRNAISTSGSSSNDSDDSDSRIHAYGGRGRRRRRTKERCSKKNYTRKSVSRVRSIEFSSRNDERRDDAHSNDDRHEVIVEEEVTRERETAPKDPARRSENNSRHSTSRSYTRTLERDLVDEDSATRGEPKVRINITNRSLSASPPSIVDETREKSVRFDQQARKVNATSQAASRQDLHKSYRYVEPLHSAARCESPPISARFSKESLPSLRTKDHAQRRRSERAYPEHAYDHDDHEQVHEHVPRRRSDKDIIVVETEHEQPEFRTGPRNMPRRRPRSSDEDFIVVETEHEFPRSRTGSRHDLRRPQERLRSPPRTPIRTRETYITSKIDQHGNETQYKWTTTSRTSSSLSSLRSFEPSIRRASSDIYHPSTIRRSSDSSEEFNRAYEMAHQNLPNPGLRRRQRSSFKSYGRFMDGIKTPPRAPDPPTLDGNWDPRYVPISRDRSTSQSNLPKVPQHQSTPRKKQAWMNASTIDQLDQLDQCLEQNRKLRVHSRSSDSQSSGSMVTQSDSFTTTSTSAGLYEFSASDSTRLSMVPQPVSVRDTTDSGNEVESTLATPSTKAILKKKPIIEPSRRRYERAEITNSKVNDNSHAVRSTSQKYRDQIGSYTAYVEYGNAAVIGTETNRFNANNRTRDVAGKDYNATIIDDATDLTLRTARSKAAVLDRVKLRRRVSFQEKPEYSATPKPSRENSWAETTNHDAEQSYGGNTYTNDQSWDANADQSYSATSNGYQSWGGQATEDYSRGTSTKTTGNSFWSSPTDTETVLPNIGGYSGGAGAKCNPLDFSGGGYASTPTPKSKSGTGGNGNTDGDGSNKNKKEADDDDDNDGWGPIPTFSSLKL